MPSPKPVRIWHLTIPALILAFCITLYTSFYVTGVEPGYVDYGFPIPWKRVYGGVTVVYDYTNLFMNVVAWFIIVFFILSIVFIYILKKLKPL